MQCLISIKGVLLFSWHILSLLMIWWCFVKGMSALLCLWWEHWKPSPKLLVCRPIMRRQQFLLEMSRKKFSIGSCSYLVLLRVHFLLGALVSQYLLGDLLMYIVIYRWRESLGECCIGLPDTFPMQLGMSLCIQLCLVSYILGTCFPFT